MLGNGSVVYTVLSISHGRSYPDWEGGAELTPKGAEGDTLLFEVLPDGGMPEKAFLRIAE